MELLDILLLTLTNTVICFGLPKLIWLFFTHNSHQKRNLPSKLQKLDSHQHQIAIFPYCTTYNSSGRPSCRLSPRFCRVCSTSG
ncbi:MAG: hypothetical protein ACFB02_07480 [Mastigocoleus sp.]